MFTIEVPIFANPLDRVLTARDETGYTFHLYGGFPDSPLNGGRNNFSLDGWDNPARFLASEAVSDVVRDARAALYREVKAANRAGIPFLLTYTNLYVSPRELTADNLAPVERLACWGQRYGVANGVILNHPSLERQLRQRYGDTLYYVASCTRYVRPRGVLSFAETLPLYVADAARFDRVVITPQHSRSSRALATLGSRHPSPFVAISNSYCADACNCHAHYRLISRENKRSLDGYGVHDIQRYAETLARIYPRCPLLSLKREDLDVTGMARRQRHHGIRNFKLGRGIGGDMLPELLAALRQEAGVDDST